MLCGQLNRDLAKLKKKKTQHRNCFIDSPCWLLNLYSCNHFIVMHLIGSLFFQIKVILSVIESVEICR